MDHKFCFVVSPIKLIIVAGIVSCLLASSTVLASNASSITVNTTQTATSTAEINNLPCLPDSTLNALLVQMLMALQPYFLSNQYQQQRMPFPQHNNNELFASITETTDQPIIRTTVVTSSVVSTLTQTLSKIISIWFRNERIPTTLYSQATTVMTDFITITSTLNVGPTEWNKRNRREVKDATFLESSLLDDEKDNFYYKTKPLPNEDESVGVQALGIQLMHPRVVEAWNNFLHVLEETQNDARKTQ